MRADMGTHRRWIIAVAALVAVAAVAAYGLRQWPHWRAQWHYRAAQPLLEAGQAEQAHAE